MEPMLAKVQERFENCCHEHGFSGVVYLGDLNSGDVLFARSRGYALRSEHIRNRIETRFQTASGSKIFTAVAILQLVQQGLLRLNTPVQEILGEDFPFGSEISVRHLLTHTSGIPDYFEEEQADNIMDYARLWQKIPLYSLESDRDFLPLFLRKPVNFAAGERFLYCNAGFLLLGMIVAKVSGMTFREYVTQRVLQPAGLIAAGYFYADRLPGGSALGFVPMRDGGWRSNIFMIPYIGGGDGGAYMSAPEWGKFWAALMGGHLLGVDLQAEMLKPQTGAGEGPDRHYGLGVWINDTGGVRVYGVVGQDPGVEMMSVCSPERALHLSVLSNQDEGARVMYEEMRVVFE